MTRREAGPLVLTEEIPFDSNYDEWSKTNPFVGPVWYNSFYWTNFPPLQCFDENQWERHKDSDFYAGLSDLNSDNRLGEQFVTLMAAREDLCQNAKMPKNQRTITAEVMQYDGVRDESFQFPLTPYVPKRDNHTPYDLNTRRFSDNSAINFGLNAEEFSDIVMPVGELDACITVSDLPPNTAPFGYIPPLMRIQGWPYRIRRLGTFEGLGEGGHTEIKLGLDLLPENHLWVLLEGSAVFAPTGPGGEMEAKPIQRAGRKYWCQLLELDWLSPKKDDSKAIDPEVPLEKGYVWFEVVGVIQVPSTGRKGVQIKLLEDGIVPAWMDLHFLQVWAGDIPLGYLNEATTDGLYDPGRVTVVRLPDQEGGDERGIRKVVIENRSNRLIFTEPINAEPNDIVDMGWAIRDLLYHGASLTLGARPGRWVDEIEGDVPHNYW